MAHKALTYELDRLDVKAMGGLLRIFSDLASGRLTESPFPKEVLSRLTGHIREITEHSRVQLQEGQVLQEQPVDVLLLGCFLKAVGDPDWQVMLSYAVGVPLGLGVDMPRTPEVFPPKRKATELR